MDAIGWGWGIVHKGCALLPRDWDRDWDWPLPAGPDGGQGRGEMQVNFNAAHQGIVDYDTEY